MRAIKRHRISVIRFGKFLTTWVESTNGKPTTQTTHLVIKRRKDAPSQYRLIWHEPGNPNKIWYYGEGMRYGNLLVASYWDPAVQKFLDPGGSTF